MLAGLTTVGGNPLGWSVDAPSIFDDEPGAHIPFPLDGRRDVRCRLLSLRLHPRNVQVLRERHLGKDQGEEARVLFPVVQNAALAPNGETLEGHPHSLALRLPPSLPQAPRFAAAAASLATIYGARILPGSISRTGHFISSEALVSVWGAGISSCAGGPTWMLAP